MCLYNEVLQVKIASSSWYDRTFTSAKDTLKLTYGHLQFELFFRESYPRTPSGGLGRREGKRNPIFLNQPCKERHPLMIVISSLIHSTYSVVKQ